MATIEPISEKLLFYIWQFQRFERKNLATKTENLPLQIVHVGQYNTNAGPDFLEAKVKIGDVLWAGNIEIHVKSSDWLSHKHGQNKAFDNVILHVVWENDVEIKQANGQKMPVLELKNIVNMALLHQYRHLMTNREPIPCFEKFGEVPEITKMHMLERALVNRLERKAEMVLAMLETNQGNWEETTYQLLAKAMGFGLNAIPFERLAQILPLKILQKHDDNILAMEALIFGTAGFLENNKNKNLVNHKKEYQFLKAKYAINYQINEHEWKFMRLRPANFPTVRLAQFAQILQGSKSLFSYFLLFENWESLKEIFRVKTANNWLSDISENETNKLKFINFGETSIDIILINVVAPILAAYSLKKNEPNYMEKAMNLLEKIKPENNKITRFWETLGFKAQNAFEGQASIELFNEFCQKKACLNCNIGANILK